MMPASSVVTFRDRKQRFTFQQLTQIVTKAVNITDLPIKPEVRANAGMDSLARVRLFVCLEYPV
jgi:hypothetical protein